MILTKREAAVIKMLRGSETRRNIARKLNIRMHELDSIVSELENQSAIQRLKSEKYEYRVLLGTYEVDENSEQAVMPKKTKVIEVLIPEEYENYIRNQYGLIPRREIARQLNLNKVTLNLMIMNLGLADKEMLQHNNQQYFKQNEM
ncbi:hypothetical protein MNQ98_04935 [Paenibacillus sp. N3/727]|uniref:hypothetical protein n=1 Tax=Paenibacillus sp. N3/727 TaxID=2925845 RepID=UPI001F53A7BB|nr:hypothetical protein [Paenibacillus sp. N3/727]UNK19381.1 hypothetical protein MNQ98_04935 [Paenibacillus sp. N3/727]